eukprot:30922-Pelagococcus_subviridis.AAC.2
MTASRSFLKFIFIFVRTLIANKPGGTDGRTDGGEREREGGTVAPASAADRIHRREKTTRRRRAPRVERPSDAPNTAPDAPRETVAAAPSPSIPPAALGRTRYDATPAPTPVNKYENQTPNVPSSSSTIRPKTYRKKMFPLRCAQLA